MAGYSAAHRYMRKSGAATDTRLSGFDLRVLWTEIDLCDWKQPKLRHWHGARGITRRLFNRQDVTEAETRQVKRSRARLRKYGYAESTQRWRDNGSQKSNITRLVVPSESSLLQGSSRRGGDNSDPPYMKRDARGASSRVRRGALWNGATCPYPHEVTESYVETLWADTDAWRRRLDWDDPSIGMPRHEAKAQCEYCLTMHRGDPCPTCLSTMP
jgi:hypothetical protein